MRCRSSSSKQADYEDETGLKRGSSSKRAVFEDEGVRRRVSGTKKADFEDERACGAVPEPVDAVAGRSLSLSKGRPGPVFRQTLHLARGGQHALNFNLLNFNELHFDLC